MKIDKPAAAQVLVWDLPVRLFHWMLAASFAGAWLTADSERWRDLHIALGYTAGVLVVLRIGWGLVGTRYARFASFVRGPRRVLAYLRSLASGRPEHAVGHNPAGGWAILALLAATLAIVATGLAVEADAGPKALEDVHEALAGAMLALVGLHVVGVLVGSLAHRENLVRAMITGRKNGSPADAIRRPRRLAAAALVALVVALWTGAVPAPGLGTLPTLTAVTAGMTASAHTGRDDDD
jgi:cytochrome b